MQRRTALTAGIVLMLTASMQPTDAFLFGILKSFFQPYPILGIKTFVEPVAIGTAYVNQSPFTTPPAPDCLSRALGLLNGCQPFLNALNANGGQLSKFTIFQLLKLAVVNKTADVTCYNAVANFFNGGCLCDNGLIATINVLNTVPAFAKQAITSLNKAKCPPSPPPPPLSPFPTAGTPPAVTTNPATTGPPVAVNVAVGAPPAPPAGRRLLHMRWRGA